MVGEMEVFEAYMNRDLKPIQKLIENGFKLNGRLKDIAVIEASSKGYFEVVKYFIDIGSKISSKSETPIIYASRNGYFKIVKLLVENRADIDKAIEYADISIKDEVIAYKEQLILNKDLVTLKTKIAAPSRRI